MIPQRIRWAVETLAVDATTECSRSAVAPASLPRLTPRHVAAGRLALETVDVADLEPGEARFNKAFAIGRGNNEDPTPAPF